MTKDELKNWFNYQPATKEQLELMERWRERVSDVAADFVANTPTSGDVIVALRSLKSAVMAMNAALVVPMPKISKKDSER